MSVYSRLTYASVSVITSRTLSNTATHCVISSYLARTPNFLYYRCNLSNQTARYSPFLSIGEFNHLKSVDILHCFDSLFDLFLMLLQYRQYMFDKPGFVVRLFIACKRNLSCPIWFLTARCTRSHFQSLYNHFRFAL